VNKDLYKPPSACTPVTPSPPAATEWSCLLLHLCCVRRTRNNALSMGMTQQFSRFCPCWPWPLTTDLDVQTHSSKTCLSCKFGVNPFSHPRDIWVTNIQTNKQTNKNLSQTVFKTEPYWRALINLTTKWRTTIIYDQQLSSVPSRLNTRQVKTRVRLTFDDHLNQ